jgi:hypothetical protein
MSRAEIEVTRSSETSLDFCRTTCIDRSQKIVPLIVTAVRTWNCKKLLNNFSKLTAIETFVILARFTGNTWFDFYDRNRGFLAFLQLRICIWMSILLMNTKQILNAIFQVMIKLNKRGWHIFVIPDIPIVHHNIKEWQVPGIRLFS